MPRRPPDSPFRRCGCGFVARSQGMGGHRSHKQHPECSETPTSIPEAEALPIIEAQKAAKATLAYTPTPRLTAGDPTAAPAVETAPFGAYVDMASPPVAPRSPDIDEAAMRHILEAAGVDPEAYPEAFIPSPDPPPPMPVGAGLSGSGGPFGKGAAGPAGTSVTAPAPAEVGVPVLLSAKTWAGYSTIRMLEVRTGQKPSTPSEWIDELWEHWLETCGEEPMEMAIVPRSWVEVAG